MNEVKATVNGSQIKVCTIITTIPNFNDIKEVLESYIEKQELNEATTEVSKNYCIEKIICVECKEKMFEIVVKNETPYIEEIRAKKVFEEILEKYKISKESAEQCANKLFKLALLSERRNTTIWNCKHASNCENKNSNVHNSAVKYNYKPNKEYEYIAKKPTWMPEGFKYYMGDIDSGYVIKDNDGNEYTYNPDSENYVSRHIISKSPAGTPMSLIGQDDWTNISFNEARKIAKKFAENADVISMDEYYIWKQFMMAKSREINNTNFISHTRSYNENSEKYMEQFSIYNICFKKENHMIWTTEKIDGLYLVVNTLPYKHSIKTQTEYADPNKESESIGFRIVLYKTPPKE